MDQFVAPEIKPARRLKAARIAKDYSLEDLAIVTGLTAAEIVAVEEEDSAAPAGHVERIDQALG